MKRLKFNQLILLLTVVLSPQAFAKSPVSVPPGLVPWQDWALYQHENQLCPTPYNQAGQHWCVWPGTLDLIADEQSGQFKQSVKTYLEGWVPLPGDADLWPVEIKINATAIPVGTFDAKPAVYLMPGEYILQGTWRWEKMPDYIPIPFGTGVVTLKRLNETIAQPERDEQGKIWLRPQAQAAKVEDTLSFKVYRLLKDDVPFLEETLLKLNVSGQIREVTLGPVLQPDTLPTEIVSTLPGRIEEDGSIRLQIKPGVWDVLVKSRYLNNPKKITFVPHTGLWPKEEVWAFQSNPILRLVNLEGGKSLDPQQTDMPEHWKTFPAFLMKPALSLSLIEKRRGFETREAENINMERKIWLKFSGQGYLFQDTLTGTLDNRWRLNTLPPFELGRITVDGQDRLITELAKNKDVGVEIRQNQLSLTSVSQIPNRLFGFPAVGWNMDVQSLNAWLFLPPGWKLFGTKGVDTVSRSWIKDWTLLDLFLVFVLAAAVSQLLGRKWGVLTLITLTLIFHESGAPIYAWLNLVIVMGLLKVLPLSGFKKWIFYYYQISLVILAVIALPFMIKQIREAIYPQLEVYAAAPIPFIPRDIGGAVSDMRVSTLARKSIEAANAPGAQVRTLMAPPPPAPVLEDYDPNAKIQTGPGVPEWQGNAHQLNWTGPVVKSQKIWLWLLPDWLVSILKVLQAILVFLLATAFVRARGLLLLPLLLAFSLSTPTDSFAQEGFPPEELLTQLRERLLEQPRCMPQCADLSKMHISVKSDQLTVYLSAQVVNQSALPLPSTLGQWSPRSVLVDGKLTATLRIDESRQLWILLEPGIHDVTLEGPLGKQDKFEIQVPLKPKNVTFDAQGWDLEGITRNQLQANSFYLTRQIETGKPNAVKEIEPGRFPPFVQYIRTLQLGHAWQVKNELIRIAPQQGAIGVNLPLLENETVLSDKVEVKNKNVFVSLGANENRIEWQSKLNIQPQLHLTATQNQSVKETWQLEAIPMWHCEYTGVPVLQNRIWQPWPKEQLTIQVTRPQAVPGNTMTLDNTHLKVVPGKRATENSLQLSVRASQGGLFPIQIPENVLIKEVLINGERQPINVKKGEMILPVNPGQQTINISWRSLEGIKTFFKTPQINLKQTTSNILINLDLNKDRWILGLGGPNMGPAVLIWGYLLVVVLVAYGLARSGFTPLNFIEWFLLGVGILVASPWAAVFVIAWFVALNQRKKMSIPKNKRAFKAIQLGLVLLTILFAVSLFTSISQGLLGLPNMQLGSPRNNLIQSYFTYSTQYQLQWYQDVSTDLLPRAWVLSVPIFVYRTLMLLWALWVAFSLLKWLRWGWNCFSTHSLWQGLK